MLNSADVLTVLAGPFSTIPLAKFSSEFDEAFADEEPVSANLPIKTKPLLIKQKN